MRNKLRIIFSCLLFSFLFSIVFLLSGCGGGNSNNNSSDKNIDSFTLNVTTNSTMITKDGTVYVYVSLQSNSTTQKYSDYQFKISDDSDGSPLTINPTTFSLTPNDSTPQKITVTANTASLGDHELTIAPVTSTLITPVKKTIKVVNSIINVKIDSPGHIQLGQSDIITLTVPDAKPNLPSIKNITIQDENSEAPLIFSPTSLTLDSPDYTGHFTVTATKGHTAEGLHTLSFSAPGSDVQFIPDETLSIYVDSDTPVSADKYVTVYLLLDSPDDLQNAINDIEMFSGKKVNFNRLVISFVNPNLTNYTSGSLKDTGLLGYFDHESAKEKNIPDSRYKQSFIDLQNLIRDYKGKNVQVLLAIGGWNYSCNIAEGYGSGNNALDPCNPGNVPDQNFSTWPNPTNPGTNDVFGNPDYDREAVNKYKNIVNLAADLGVDGIDIDYEEFWHADVFSYKWNATNPSVYDYLKKFLPENEGGIQPYAGGVPPYNGLITANNGDLVKQQGPMILPKTIDKFYAIINMLDGKIKNSAKPSMILTAAVPPVGGIPIMTVLDGDNESTVYTKGGLWWGGNLKGLIYELTDKDGLDKDGQNNKNATINKLDSIGVMTYDLCGGSDIVCSPYYTPSGYVDLDLQGQVSYYIGSYKEWLKHDPVLPGNVTQNGWWPPVDYKPTKYTITPKIQFGFEVNKPAYPRDGSGHKPLPLSDSIADKILIDQKNNTDGVIIWQLYSIPAKDVTSVKTIINDSCDKYLSKDTHFDCNADFPSAKTNQ